MRLRLLLASTLLLGCFTEDGGDAGDTDANVVAGCRECLLRSCADRESACAGDAECDACITAPYGLACLANTNMHALGSCACNQCANECDYLCPGPPGECNNCGIDTCMTEGSACLGDPMCAPCLQDAYREGCAENANFMAAQMCSCTNCGQACIWECPMAGNTCASCFSMQCGDPLTQCMADETCSDCFAAPYLAACDSNMPFQTLLVCVCGSCPADCSVLYDCGA
jgi:hypothetical protein